MRPSPLRHSGGGQYPYPKEVWTPSGGWWTRPKNWKSNTTVIGVGLIATVYGIWSLSADREERTVPPFRWIPSLMWSRQYKEHRLVIRDEKYTPVDEQEEGHGHGHGHH